MFRKAQRCVTGGLLPLLRIHHFSLLSNHTAPEITIKIYSLHSQKIGVFESCLVVTKLENVGPIFEFLKADLDS